METTTPCATCPWRRDSDPHKIPGLSLCQARALSNTVGDGDAFRPIMACHGSPEGGERACVGYVATVGYTNLGVRMMALRGEVDFDPVDADLYETFDEMLDNIEARW